MFFSAGSMFSRQSVIVDVNGGFFFRNFGLLWSYRVMRSLEV